MTTSSAEESSATTYNPTRERVTNKLRAAFLVSSAFSAITGTGTVAPGPEILNVQRFLAPPGASSARGGAAQAKSSAGDDARGDTNRASGPRLLDPFAVERPDQMELVKWIHDASGLTWNQIARLLGVSRRSVHMWANGGRMNATNAETLNALAAVIQAVPSGTPDQRRAYLLAPRGDGRSALDEFRAERTIEHGMNASTFAPDELIGALHDDQTTVSGRD